MTTKTKWHLGVNSNGVYKMYNSPNAKSVLKFDNIDSAMDCVEENKDFILQCGSMITKCQIVFKCENTPMTLMKEYAILSDMLVNKEC